MSNHSKTQKPVTVSREEGKVSVSINCPVTFSLPDTKATLKFLAVFLRLLFARLGDNVLTLQQTASLLGYKDRRDVDNYCREFARKGYDIAAFLNRKVENLKLIPELEKFVLRNIMMPLHVMRKEFCRIHNRKMSQTTFNKYIAEVNAVTVLKRSQEIMWDKATSGNTVEVLKLLADQHNIPVVCDHLLASIESKNSTEPTPNKAFLSLDQTQRCMLVHYLVGSNLNFSTIALLMNVSKATISNWFHQIKNLHGIIINSISKWSGKISIDEKFIRINGVPHYIIIIVDYVTGIPLYLNVYTSTKKEAFEACFRAFKLLYKVDPILIVSDGSKSLAAARKAVFPNVHYQLCKFHKMRNLFAVISKSNETAETKFMLKQKIVAVMKRETVSGRKKGLRELKELAPDSAVSYIENNIIGQWRQLSKGLTSNVSERFNRKIEKVTKSRYGLKSVNTALTIALSLWLKVLIDKGRPILHDESLIASLNISRLCQENVDWTNLAHLFSATVKKTA